MRKMFVPIVYCLCLASSLSADEGLSPKTLAAIKRATVFVEVEVEGLSGSGSGFVVSVHGTSALIVTNHHVVEPKIIAQARQSSNVILAAFPPTRISRPPLATRGPRPPMTVTVPRPHVRALPPEFTPRVIIRTLKNAAVTVVFDSGTKDERSAKAELLAIDPDYDLAVMRVKDVKNLPDPIKFEKAIELAETMPVYTFGFPFGKVLATSKGHPAMTVGKAAISSLREDDDGELAVVQIDGGLNPGNSGGPIVNANGELVGVAVATIRNANGIGLAIPAGPLRNIFEGRIGAVHLASRPNAEKPAIAIEVSVIDPLNKITAVELHSIGISRAKADLDKGIESLEALPGSDKTKLTLEKQLASGELALASDASEKEFLVQAVYSTAQGKPRKTRVFRQSLQTPAVAAVNPKQNPNPAGPQRLSPVEFDDRAPDKGLLIGFEIGLGQFVNVDIVTAIRPIYRADKKEVLGKQYGTILKEVVAVKAKEGYAVGGMTLRTGALVNGLSLTFMRARDGKLDPGDSYESDWIGDKTGGTEKPRQGNGTPVFGIAGETNDKYFKHLSLVFDGKETSVASGGGGAAGGGRGGAGPGAETKTPAVPPNSDFKDVAPEKGLLIGFELGFGSLFNQVALKAVRPIFRTGKDEVLGTQYGTDLNRVIVVKAKEGYAVGGMTVSGFPTVRGLSVQFLRVGKGKLDSKDSYETDWLGEREVRSEKVIKADGTPVIGIAGKMHATDCGSFDLVFEKATAVATITPDQDSATPKSGSGAAGKSGGSNSKANGKASSGKGRRDADMGSASGNGKSTTSFDPFFKEQAPEKSLLIGFDLGLGRFLNTQIVVAIRPIYRGDKGKDILGNVYGPNVEKVIRVKAKAGYAVGGMTIRTGALVNGLSLIFMRVVDGKLDQADSYESDWVASTDGGDQKTIRGDGAPAVGISGRMSEKQLEFFELLFETKTGAANAARQNQAADDDGGKTRSGGAGAGNGSARGVAGEATKILGGGGKAAFKDQAPEDGLLVGLEIGLGKFINLDVVKAIRPIYRTDDEDTLGKQYGAAPQNVVVVKAKPGYAIGAVTVRSGLLVNGLSVTFMRVLVGKLDPSDSYQSDWIGDRTGGSETTLTGHGTPVVGIVGKASDKECTGIGLLFDK